MHAHYKAERLKLFRDIITALARILKNSIYRVGEKRKVPEYWLSGAQSYHGLQGVGLFSCYDDADISHYITFISTVRQFYSLTSSHVLWRDVTKPSVSINPAAWWLYHDAVQDISPVPDATCRECYWACTWATYSIPISYSTRFPWSTISTIRGIFWSLAESFRTQHLLKKFPAFYGPWKFIAMFTTARHWTLTRARWIQFTTSNPIYLISTLILQCKLNNSDNLYFFAYHDPDDHFAAM
jgi:hypothetical protein